METALEYISPTLARLSVKAKPEELAVVKEQVLAKLGGELKVPGFRLGKAPAKLVEKQLDSNTLAQETLESAINELYFKALAVEKLRSVNQPKINLKSYVPYTDLSFSAEVEVIGKLTLGKYQGLKVAKSNVKVEAKEIDEVIARLQDQLAVKDEVKREVKPGDEVVIDFSGVDFKTKEPIGGADGNDYHLVIGSSAFIPGFEDKLVGAKVGKPVEFNITFPKDYGAANLRNKQATFKVSIKQVFSRTLPELDDSFATKVGPFKLFSELRQNIKQELNATKNREELAKTQNAVVEQLVAASKVDIPPSLVDEESSRIEQEQRQNAAYHGLTWAEYLANQDLSESDFTDSAKKQAEIRIKTGLVLGELASKEDIQVTEAELATQLSELRRQYANDQKMQAELSKSENIQDIKNRLVVEKTVNRLLELNS